MMTLPFDPVDKQFWQKVRALPGFPQGDTIPLRQILIESNAVYRLDDVLNRMGVSRNTPLLVVMDSTPMRRGGDDLKPMVLSLLRQSGWEVEPYVLLPDAGGQVHTDMARILQVKERLGMEKAVISVGSGVVTDITKHACFLYEQEIGYSLPFLVYQTANSVSAYTSNMAPTLIDGVKRTLPSRYPDALVCDLETLRDAPRQMTVAGVGDLLAAAVSFADWYLAFRLGMDDGYNPLPELLMGSVVDLLLQNAEAVQSGTLEAMALLAKLITLGGLAMSLTHATTPLSGYEHVISHTLDLQNEAADKPLVLHGIQVALTTVLGCAAYQIFLRRFRPDPALVEKCYPQAEQMHDLILRTFHPLDAHDRAGEECWSDYRLKLEKWYASKAKLLEFIQDWDGIQHELAKRTRTPQQIREIFALAGGPRGFREIQPPLDEETVRFAFLNAPLIRKRLTIGDLFLFFGWDRQALWREIWELTQGALLAR